MDPARPPIPDKPAGGVLDVLEAATRCVASDAGDPHPSPLRRWQVDAGTMISEAGTPVTEIHVVVSGSVELRRAEDPRRAVISVLHRGGVFGDIPEILGRPHHVDAVAVSAVELLSLRWGRFIALLGESSDLARAWSVSLAERVLETHCRLGELLAGHLDHRVGAVLLRRVDLDGRVDLTQEAMARLLGVQRSSVNEVIRRLELRGLIRRGYGHVVVIDREGLAALLAPECP